MEDHYFSFFNQFSRLMLPDERDSVYVDPDKLADAPVETSGSARPADRLENTRLIGWLLGGAGVAYMFDYYVVRGGSLNLNIINFSFLFLAILLHGNARRLLTSGVGWTALLLSTAAMVNALGTF